MLPQITNRTIPFWTPVICSNCSANFSSILIKIGSLADQYLYLGNQEICLIKKSNPLSITKVYNSSKLTLLTLKIVSFILTGFILPLVALPIKFFYKIYLRQIATQSAHLEQTTHPKPNPASAAAYPLKENSLSSHDGFLSRPFKPNNQLVAEKVIGESKLLLMVGDITHEKADIIVNAANRRLEAGSGVCGAIYKKAGPGVFQECKQALQVLSKPALSCGEAIYTSAGKLAPRIKAIIHAVGPDCNNTKERKQRKMLLRKAYKYSLTLAAHLARKSDNKIRTVAFPSLSTGVYAYPAEEAAKIALKTVRSFLIKHPKVFDEVRFVFMPPETGDLTVKAYKQAFDALEKTSAPENCE